MARLTPQEMQDKYARRLKASTPDITAGIKRVTEAPGVAAARQEAVMAANLQAAISSGKWRKKVAAVTAQDWQNAAINKGVGRIAAGVDGAKDKTTAAFTNVLADVDATLAEVNRTPRGDFNTNVQRSVAMMTGMRNRADARNKG